MHSGTWRKRKNKTPIGCHRTGGICKGNPTPLLFDEKRATADELVILETPENF
jgi:hypothetical protein